MPRIENSIDINADAQLVFDIINDVTRWPDLFDEYRQSKVLSTNRDGRYTEILFELTNAEGACWRSWRLLDHQELTAVAERREPLFPFGFMHLRWTAQRIPQGTRMTWIQDFEMAEGYDAPLETVLDRMQRHTQENQLAIKQKIESGSVPPP